PALWDDRGGPGTSAAGGAAPRPRSEYTGDLVTRASGDHCHRQRSPQSLSGWRPRGCAASHASRRPLSPPAEPRRSPRSGVQRPWARAQGGERRAELPPRHPSRWPYGTARAPKYADAAGPDTGSAAPGETPRHLRTGLDAAPAGVVASPDRPAPWHW